MAVAAPAGSSLAGSAGRAPFTSCRATCIRGPPAGRCWPRCCRRWTSWGCPPSRPSRCSRWPTRSTPRPRPADSTGRVHQPGEVAGGGARGVRPGRRGRGRWRPPPPARSPSRCTGSPPSRPSTSRCPATWVGRSRSCVGPKPPPTTTCSGIGSTTPARAALGCSWSATRRADAVLGPTRAAAARAPGRAPRPGGRRRAAATGRRVAWGCPAWTCRTATPWRASPPPPLRRFRRGLPRAGLGLDPGAPVPQDWNA